MAAFLQRLLKYLNWEQPHGTPPSKDAIWDPHRHQWRMPVKHWGGRALSEKEKAPVSTKVKEFKKEDPIISCPQCSFKTGDPFKFRLHLTAHDLDRRKK